MHQNVQCWIIGVVFHVQPYHSVSYGRFGSLRCGSFNKTLPYYEYGDHGHNMRLNIAVIVESFKLHMKK